MMKIEKAKGMAENYKAKIARVEEGKRSKDKIKYDSMMLNLSNKAMTVDELGFNNDPALEGVVEHVIAREARSRGYLLHALQLNKDRRVYYVEKLKKNWF